MDVGSDASEDVVWGRPKGGFARRVGHGAEGEYGFEERGKAMSGEGKQGHGEEMDSISSADTALGVWHMINGRSCRLNVAGIRWT